MNFRIVTFILIFVFAFLSTAYADQKERERPELSSDKKKVTVLKDAWGREIKIVGKINKVVSLNKFYTQVLHILGCTNCIVGVDSDTKHGPFINAICPKIRNIPNLGSIWEKSINIESLCATDANVVLLRAWVPKSNLAALKSYKKLVDRIEGINIPVVAMKDPSSFDKPNMNVLFEEIQMIGRLMGKEKEAARLMDYFKGKINLIKTRTEKIAENERQTVMLFATTDSILGPDTIQSAMLETIIHAKNVVAKGGWIKTSEEKLLALDPDVLILLGHMGYLEKGIVYRGEKWHSFNWGNLKGMKAIREKKVASIGFTEWSMSVEFIVGLLRQVKCIYPNRFNDIDLNEEETLLYKEIYHLDDDRVQLAIAAQRNPEDTD